MATGVEDGVEVLGPDAVEANRCREPRFCVCISFEPMRKVGLKVGLGSRGGWPPFGEASVISAPASLNVK
jgi:hypothetical protein